MKFTTGQRVYPKRIEDQHRSIFKCLMYEGSGYWRGYYERTEINVDYIHESEFEAITDPNTLLKGML